MKNLIPLILAATILAGCQVKTTIGTTPHQIGVVIDSSANISTIKKLLDLNAAINDTSQMKQYYADTAKIVENSSTETLHENLAKLTEFKKARISILPDGKPTVVENIYSEKHNGHTHWVMAYAPYMLVKGSKKVKVILEDTFAMENGRVVLELAAVDTGATEEVMK